MSTRDPGGAAGSGAPVDVVATTGPPPDRRPAAVPGSTPARSTRVQPTDQELRISGRLLLHIARQPRPGPDDIPLDTLTQAGMAHALGLTQGAVSGALKRLVDGGAVRVERSHVRQQILRLKVYSLTPQGEHIVREIRRRFGM